MSKDHCKLRAEVIAEPPEQLLVWLELPDSSCDARALFDRIADADHRIVH